MFNELRYTLCFLTRSHRVLMLYRYNPPNQFLWNGIGGRIEPGESPLEACLREVREESGYVLDTARFAGVLTWRGFEIEEGGLYLFTAQAPAGEVAPCAEGVLEWKTREWVFNSPQVVSNIHYFGPVVLNGGQPRKYHFEYEAGEIVRYEAGSLLRMDFD